MRFLISASCVGAFVAGSAGAGTFTPLLQVGNYGAQPGVIISFQEKLYFGVEIAGKTGNGSLMSLNPVSGAAAVVYSFSGPVGSVPNSLTPFTRGGVAMLHGSTAFGGTGYVNSESGFGTLFDINLQTGKLTTRFSFDCNNGNAPVPSLYSGKTIFGATYLAGCPYDYGTIFSLDSSKGVITTLHDFTTESDGASPSYVMEISNTLLGTTAFGGANGFGTIFSYDLQAGTKATLHNFTSAEGTGATRLTMAANGKLYGTLAGSSTGTPVPAAIYQYDRSGNTVTVLYRLNPQTEGVGSSQPYQAGNGLLWGVCQAGGPGGQGTLWSFNPATNKLTVQHGFTGGVDGAHPTALALTRGVVYGTTYYGGTGGGGVVFGYTY